MTHLGGRRRCLLSFENAPRSVRPVTLRLLRYRREHEGENDEEQAARLAMLASVGVALLAVSAGPCVGALLLQDRVERLCGRPCVQVTGLAHGGRVERVPRLGRDRGRDLRGRCFQPEVTDRFDAREHALHGPGPSCRWDFEERQGQHTFAIRLPRLRSSFRSLLSPVVERSRAGTCSGQVFPPAFAKRAAAI